MRIYSAIRIKRYCQTCTTFNLCSWMFVGLATSALFTLALLTQSSLYSALLLLPIALLIRHGPESRLARPTLVSDWRSSLLVMLGFVPYMLALGAIATLVTGDLGWMKETWGATWVWTILTDGVLIVAQDWLYRIWLQMSGCGGTSSLRCLTISEISFWWCLRYVPTHICAFDSSWDYSIRHLWR